MEFIYRRILLEIIDVGPLVYTGVPEQPPQKKREYLGKCVNLNFKQKNSYLNR
jgi:hypothetical protein